MCTGSAQLGDLCGVSKSMECEFLSVLSYPRFFLSVLLYLVILVFCSGYLTVLYLITLFSVCSLGWFSCQYLPSDWLERLI